MMAQYPDVFIMTFSIHIPNFVLLPQTAQLLLIFCYAAPLSVFKLEYQLYLSVSSLEMTYDYAPGMHNMYL